MLLSPPMLKMKRLSRQCSLHPQTRAEQPMTGSAQERQEFLSKLSFAFLDSLASSYVVMQPEADMVEEAHLSDA